MTNERKIEILKKCKFLIRRGNAICTAFFESCSIKEESPNSLTILHHLGDTFIKHKPKHKEINELWFDNTKENIPKRISIINEMILELKSQMI